MPSNIDPWPEVCDKLNRSLRGWSNYFGYGSRGKAYRSVDQYVFERVRQVPRAKAQGARARQSPIHIRCHSSRTRRSVPPTPAPSGPVACLAVKPDGKPEIGTSGLKSGDGKRDDGQRPPSYRAHPRLYRNGPVCAREIAPKKARGGRQLYYGRNGARQPDCLASGARRIAGLSLPDMSVFASARLTARFIELRAAGGAEFRDIPVHASCYLRNIRHEISAELPCVRAACTVLLRRSSAPTRCGEQNNKKYCRDPADVKSAHRRRNLDSESLPNSPVPGEVVSK